MNSSQVSYDYPEYDFIDFLYLNGYLTERPTNPLPDAPDRTPFENEVRRISATLNCQRRKPAECIDPFYKSNFRWVFTVENESPDCRIAGAALLRAHDPFASTYDLLYFNAEEGLEEDTLQALWKHVGLTMDAEEDDLFSADIRESMTESNATFLDYLTKKF